MPPGVPPVRPVPSPFLKSLASLAHHPSIPFLQPPRLLNQNLNLNLTIKTLGPTRANFPLSCIGGGRRPSSFFPLNRPYWSGWINRRSMPAVRALAPTKGGFGFGFRSDSNLAKRAQRQGPGAMGTDADSGLDPVSPVGEGQVVNGFCYKNTSPPPPPPRLLTLPTLLTLGRVAAVPLLISTFYMEGPWGTTATTSIFLLAAITDWLDGYIARKMQLGTAFGAFLDPVADKLMVAATLVLLCTRPFEVPLLAAVPWLLPVPSIAIIGREITMSAVREWAASQDKRLLEAVAVNNLGKWKTATQMTALTILLLIRDPSLTGQTTLVASGVALLYVSAGLAVWSLVVYMKKIWKVLIK